MDPASVSLVFGLIKETVTLAPDVLSLINGVEEGDVVTQEDIDEIKKNREEIDKSVDEFMQD
jgi:hypothetical protein